MFNLSRDPRKQICEEHFFRQPIAYLKNFIDYNYVAIDVRNNAGETLLHLSVRHNNVEFAKELIKRGVSVNVADKRGNTPLHTAVELDNLGFVKFFVQNHANISFKNIEKMDPLDLAYKSKKNAISSFLFESIKQKLDIKIANPAILNSSLESQTTANIASSAVKNTTEQIIGIWSPICYLPAATSNATSFEDEEKNSLTAYRKSQSGSIKSFEVKAEDITWQSAVFVGTVKQAESSQILPFQTSAQSNTASFNYEIGKTLNIDEEPLDLSCKKQNSSLSEETNVPDSTIFKNDKKTNKIVYKRECSLLKSRLAGVGHGVEPQVEALTWLPVTTKKKSKSQEAKKTTFESSTASTSFSQSYS